MIQFILGLGPFIYPFLYIGIIFLGGIVLMPSLYFSIHGGVFNILFLFIASLLAGITADSFWYYIGARAKKDKLYSLRFVKKRMEEAEKFSEFFVKRGVLLTFVTKFVYGTRIASHILAGMHKINYLKFLLATCAGTVLWFLIFYFLIKSIDLGIDSVKATAFKIEIFFLIIVSLSFTLNWFTGKYIRKKMEIAAKAKSVRKQTSPRLK